MIVSLFLALCALVMLGLFLYTWYRLRKQVYIKILKGDEAPDDYHLPATLQYARNSDKQTIAYWYIPAKKNKAVVILVHGYRPPHGGKSIMLPHAKYLHQAGYSCAVVDLRAHGDSDGEKITFGIGEWKDVVAVYQTVKSKPENKNTKIGFFGISMGGATSISAAGRTGSGDFVIASVPYTSIDRLFRYQIQQSRLPRIPFVYFMKLASFLEFGIQYNRYSPIHMIRHIHVPVLLFAAKNDETVDYEGVRQLYDAANQPKALWEADASHDIHKDVPKEFEKRILTFLDTYTQ